MFDTQLMVASESATWEAPVCLRCCLCRQLSGSLGRQQLIGLVFCLFRERRTLSQTRACHNPLHALRNVHFPTEPDLIRNLQEKSDLNGNYFPKQYKLSSDVCGLFTPVSWKLCLACHRFCLLPPSERLRRSAFEPPLYLFIHFVPQK